MARLPRSLLVLPLSLPALVSDASAERALLRGPQTPQRASVRMQTTVIELDPTTLPAVKLPPAPDTRRTPPPAPSPLPSGSPAELRVIENSPTPPGVRKPASRSVRVEASGSGLLSIGWPQSAGRSTSLSFTCYDQSRNPGRAISWEVLEPAANGSLRWIVAEGWFDEKECRVAPGPRSEQTLRTVASFDDRPLVYGARSDEALVLVVPAFFNAQADGLHQPPVLLRGTISRMTIPLVRGSSAMVAGPIPHHSLAAWRKALEGKEPPALAATSPLSTVPLQLRIDASQAIHEAAPVVLISLQTPQAVEQPPPVAPPTPAFFAPKLPPRKPGITIKQPARSIALGLSDPFARGSSTLDQRR